MEKLMRYKSVDTVKEVEVADISCCEDISGLVAIATGDPRLDKTNESFYKIYGAPPARESMESRMRIAAVERLAEIGAHEALSKVVCSDNARLSGVAGLALSKITDQNELYRIARNTSINIEARRSATESITNRSMLKRLATRTGKDEEFIAKKANMRLQELRSEEICHGEHDWEFISERTTTVGETFTRYKLFRCKRCGLEREDETECFRI